MKRLFGFLIMCILFIVIGSKTVLDIQLLGALILPLVWIGDGLRALSLAGGLLDVLSSVLYGVLVLLPLMVVGKKVLKKTHHTIDFIFCPMLSILIGLVVYAFINPHLLLDLMNPNIDLSLFDSLDDLQVILLSGVAYILYSVLALYMIVLLYVSQTLKSIDVFKVLMDVIILGIAFSVLSQGLSSLIEAVNAGASKSLKTLLIVGYSGDVIVFFLSVLTLNLFRRFIIMLEANGFDLNLLGAIYQLYTLSFVVLLVSLIFQALNNIMQFALLKDLMTINFSIDVPVITLVIVLLLYIFSRYMKRVIEVKQDSEMII